MNLNISHKIKILTAVLFTIIFVLLLSLFLWWPPSKQQSKEEYHTLNEYICDGKATALLLKETPILWSGFTYRYDVCIKIDKDHFAPYTIWVDNDKKVTQFGPDQNKSK